MNVEAKTPKVLVISSNAFSKTRNNGKTLASFFDGWPKTDIAQLYFYPELPTSDICDNYFKITDSDILHSLYQHPKHCGSKLEKSDEELSKRGHGRGFYQNWIIDSELARLLRDILWLNGAWNNEVFWAWIDDFSPDVIFFNGGGNIFQYRIAKAIAKRQKISIAAIFSDDYFLPRLSASPAYWIRLWWLRQTFSGLCNSRDMLAMTLCQLMAQVYEEEFGFKSIVLPYSLVLPELMPPPPPPPPGGRARLIYLGGLHLNRWKTLGRLGRCLAKCESLGIKAQLDIHCQEAPSAEILNEITIPGFSSYCGPLTSQQVSQKLLEGNILVHVESFDYINRKATRLSMSTKIPEYLSSARCILAIGPEEVSSIQYLKNSNCAKIVVEGDDESLIAALKEILRDQGIQDKLRKNAWETAKTNHDLPTTKARLRGLLRGLAGEMPETI